MLDMIGDRGCTATRRYGILLVQLYAGSRKCLYPVCIMLACDFVLCFFHLIYLIDLIDLIDLIFGLI